MSLTVSIAMCSFNGSRFIGEQLQSLAHQSLKPLEIIVCDDQSDDGTLDVVGTFSTSSNIPLRIIRNQERVGYRRNFMQAAQLCRGDLVAFCDQDDVWRPDKLELTAASFADPQVLMSHHNARVTGPGGEVLGQVIAPGDHPSMAEPLGENPWRYCLGFTQTFRRELNAFGDLRESILGEGETEWTAHDQWISFLAGALGRVAYLPDGLVDYRQHGTNAYGYVNNRAPDRPFKTLMGKLGAYRDYRILERISGRRAQVLEEVAKRSAAPSSTYQPPEGDTASVSALEVPALHAAGYYRTLQALYARRARVYSAPNPATRLASWTGMIAGGDYRARATPSFRSVSVLRDLVQGVALAKLKDATAPSADYSLR